MNGSESSPRQADRIEGLSSQIRSQVDLLGRLLGEAIKEQAGEDVFSMVEALRVACQGAAENGDPEVYKRMRRQIGKLNLDQLFWLIRSFTTFFHLVNEAERQEIVRKGMEAADNSTSTQQPLDSIQGVVSAIRGEGQRNDDIRKRIDAMDIQPTLTAHPTEVRRGSILRKQRRVADLLASIPTGGRMSSLEGKRNIKALRNEIALLLATEGVRSDPLLVNDEIRNGLYYCQTTIWDTVPRILSDIHDAVLRSEDLRWDVPPFLRYRTWIGGDRDGNPHVTPEVTQAAFSAYKDAALHNYMKELEALRDGLSISNRRVDIPSVLTEDLKREQKTFSLENARRYRHEPFRLKVAYMMARIALFKNEPESREYSPERFTQDLLLLRRALDLAGLKSLADYETLDFLIIRSRIFGFHLAAVDIRQHSRIHEAAVAELLRMVRVTENYTKLTEPEKIETLTFELDNPRPMAGRHAKMTRATRDVLSVFTLIGEAIDRNPDAVGAYIVSMTHSISDVLEVLLLAKEAGLVRRQGGKMTVPLDIVPLFETIADLKRGAGLLEKLIEDKHYRRHLRSRNDFQEIMLGYSDSNKDGGYWMANWCLESALQELAGICRDRGIHFRFFHGRGGSIGRGGGQANQAILAMPAVSRNGRIRFTEQGETISFHYARPSVAHRHLEQIVAAVMMSVHNDQCGFECRPDMKRVMESMARRSMAAYRALIDHPRFWEWFRDITPIDHIGKLPIASRPVSRSSGESMNFENLRAIPWVFSWTQTRYNLPGWFGIGTALTEEVAANEDNRKLFCEMYEMWPFFRAVLDNAQLEMVRTRLPISAVYDTLSGQSFHGAIASEYALAKEGILSITGQKALLEHHPHVRSTVQLRNPYTDILNLVQVELLKRWKGDALSGREPLRHALFLTINGIAAAMQSTG